MIFMDAVMSKLCSKFSDQILSQQDQRQIMTGIEQTIAPYLRQKSISKGQVEIVVDQKDMMQYLNEGLGMNVRANEMEYIAHVLGREEWNGIIVYNELMQIISNFTFKEQLFQNSIQEGIRYDEISHPETYEYLIALRSLIGP